MSTEGVLNLCCLRTCTTAIEPGPVDELRIFRNPVVVGRGTPFLSPVAEDVRVDLVETRTFGSRMIYELYGPPAMSRIDTALRVISASPDRGAALTESDALAVWLPRSQPVPRAIMDAGT